MKRLSKSLAFTLIEILVTISIIAILASLILPAIGRSVDEGKAIKCTNFLRQLGAAAMVYATEHDMTLPVTSHQRKEGGKSWSLTLQQYAGGKIVFRCPCDENATRTYSYVMNDYLTPNPSGAADLDYSRLSRLPKPSQTFLFAEAAKTYTGSDHFHFAEYHGQEMPMEVFAEQVAVKRHAGSANYVFADGHMEKLTSEQTAKLLRNVGSRFVDPTVEDLATN